MIQPALSRSKTTLNSPGKINIHLAIGEKRADGFHALDSIIAALGFADSLTFSFFPENKAETALIVKKEGPFLELSQKGQYFPPLPAEKNMVFLAVELFRSKTGLKTTMSIELVKRIPPGSGLGGSSSNAASTLLTLNNLAKNAGNKLSDNEILDLASKLGSDVPFFVEIALNSPKKSPARVVNGRGEIFRFLPPPNDQGILLAFPGFSSHTVKAYQLLDEQRLSDAEKHKKSSLFSTDFSWNSPETWNFSNDFQSLFINNGTEQEKTSYQAILSDLKDAGASFVSLSGSGSACFGIFSSPKEAEQAGKKLTGSFYVLQSTFFLLYN